jgi:hypothetical protein
MPPLWPCERRTLFELGEVEDSLGRSNLCLQHEYTIHPLQLHINRPSTLRRPRLHLLNTDHPLRPQLPSSLHNQRVGRPSLSVHTEIKHLLLIPRLCDELDEFGGGRDGLRDGLTAWRVERRNVSGQRWFRVESQDGTGWRWQSERGNEPALSEVQNGAHEKT